MAGGGGCLPRAAALLAVVPLHCGGLLPPLHAPPLRRRQHAGAHGRIPAQRHGRDAVEPVQPRQLLDDAGLGIDIVPPGRRRDLPLGRAAIDTEIEVTVDEATGVRTAEITKQRDLPGKGTRIGFRLEAVQLGVNQWGTPRSSCVVVTADAPPKREQGRRQSELAGAIVEFLAARGTGARKGDIVKHFEERHHKASIYKELKKLHDAGRVYEVAGLVSLLNVGKCGA